jgi:hypothetical protein
VDVDWFTFNVAAGEALALTVDQTSGLTDGDLDVLLFDVGGTLWAVAATGDNPETISGTGLPAGTYYLVVYYYDGDSSAAGACDYTLSLTLTAGSGCADRDDCAGLAEHGECSGGLCVPFQGNGTQGPGAFCDSSDDCDPSTTGSTYLDSHCFTASPTQGADNVCVLDCDQESDCTPYGMHCAIVSSSQSPAGLCLAPCSSDAGCGGLTCDIGTGICQ